MKRHFLTIASPESRIMNIRGPLTGIEDECERVLRTLPLWFGHEESASAPLSSVHRQRQAAQNDLPCPPD
ncbi:MAG: hypothetical protein PHS32_12645 [Rhodoferax sp.]|uniref:hypothetical protein n=1 Tax=Rhodoferax sp. TaxID=50421 RepID=UPI00263838DE|nr:hypothetical protein [Rhodoferax sp.]MDD5334580.1 hypothetical protein [Rhodoferax sp.]